MRRSAALPLCRRRVLILLLRQQQEDYGQPTPQWQRARGTKPALAGMLRPIGLCSDSAVERRALRATFLQQATNARISAAEDYICRSRAGLRLASASSSPSSSPSPASSSPSPSSSSSPPSSSVRIHLRRSGRAATSVAGRARRSECQAISSGYIWSDIQRNSIRTRKLQARKSGWGRGRQNPRTFTELGIRSSPTAAQPEVTKPRHADREE